MRLRPVAAACAVMLVTAAVSTACSSPAEVSPPVPPDEAEPACSALVAALPDAVLDQGARAIEPDSPYAAAWGSPAIVLRCGVSRPAALTPTSQLISVNGVDWLPEELTEGYVFTTFGRVANVEVTVPDDYEPEAGPLAELSTVIAQRVPTLREPAG
jgi:Protein of unknown function (DUF3515)